MIEKALFVGVAAAVGWWISQEIRKEVPGSIGLAVGGAAGLLAERATMQWMSKNA